jgi:DNA-binding NarL/FixJ family response regulator
VLSSSARRPVTVALVDDYDVVLKGLAHMFDGYRDRVVVAEIDANMSVQQAVDVVLYDSFAQPESDHHQIGELLNNPNARHVVVYTWNIQPELVDAALRLGVHGYLSKTLPAAELVAAIEAVNAGEIVTPAHQGRAPSAPGLDWPGRREGITDRESEILALITQGMSNADVARVTYLSPNTVKSYIRSVYRKIGATSRVEAVLYGIHHGFAPDTNRIEHWLGGP